MRQKLKNGEPVVRLGILCVEGKSALDQRSALFEIAIDVLAGHQPSTVRRSGAQASTYLDRRYSRRLDRQKTTKMVT